MDPDEWERQWELEEKKIALQLEKEKEEKAKNKKPQSSGIRAGIRKRQKLAQQKREEIDRAWNSSTGLRTFANTGMKTNVTLDRYEKVWD